MFNNNSPLNNNSLWGSFTTPYLQAYSSGTPYGGGGSFAPVLVPPSGRGCFDGGSGIPKTPTFPTPSSSPGGILNLYNQTNSADGATGNYHASNPTPLSYNDALLQQFNAPNPFAYPLDDDPHGLKLFHFLNYGIAHPNPFNNPFFASLLNQSQPPSSDETMNSNANSADTPVPVPPSGDGSNGGKDDGGNSAGGDAGKGDGADGGKSGGGSIPSLPPVDPDGPLPTLKVFISKTGTPDGGQTPLPPTPIPSDGSDGGDGSKGDEPVLNPPRLSHPNVLLQAAMNELAAKNTSSQGYSPYNNPLVETAMNHLGGPPATLQLALLAMPPNNSAPFPTQNIASDVNPGSLSQQIGTMGFNPNNQYSQSTSGGFQPNNSPLDTWKVPHPGVAASEVQKRSNHLMDLYKNGHHQALEQKVHLYHGIATGALPKTPFLPPYQQQLQAFNHNTLKYFFQQKAAYDQGQQLALSKFQPQASQAEVLHQPHPASNESYLKDKNFMYAMQYLRDVEKGSVDNIHDLGGKTNLGVTHSTYEDYAKRHHWPNHDIKKITKAEAYEIYYNEYWKKSGADKLPPPWGLMVFDVSVNTNIPTAKALYRDSHGSIEKFLQLRKEQYIRYAHNPKHPDQIKNLAGWLNRLEKLRAAVYHIQHNR
jgi:Glycosyl hydrolase 108